MTFQHHYFDKLTPEDQQNTLDDIDRVMCAVFDLGPDADPTELKKLFAQLKPDDPTQLEYVDLEEAA